MISIIISVCTFLMINNWFTTIINHWKEGSEAEHNVHSGSEAHINHRTEVTKKTSSHQKKLLTKKHHRSTSSHQNPTKPRFLFSSSGRSVSAHMNRSLPNMAASMSKVSSLFVIIVTITTIWSHHHHHHHDFQGAKDLPDPPADDDQLPVAQRRRQVKWCRKKRDKKWNDSLCILWKDGAQYKIWTWPGATWSAISATPISSSSLRWDQRTWCPCSALAKIWSLMSELVGAWLGK